MKKSNFALWQLGQLFDEASGFFVVELGKSPACKACTSSCTRYGRWPATASFPFFVRVTKGSLRSGGALTFIVKVREGLDL